MTFVPATKPFFGKIHVDWKAVTATCAHFISPQHVTQYAQTSLGAAECLLMFQGSIQQLFQNYLTSLEEHLYIKYSEKIFSIFINLITIILLALFDIKKFGMVSLLLTGSVSVMFSRLYLGVHSPADIVVGGIVGCVILAYWIKIDSILDRYISFGDNGE